MSVTNTDFAVSDNSASPRTISVTAGATNNYILVFVCVWDRSNSPSSVTIGGAAADSLGTARNNGSGGNILAYGLEGVTAGSVDVVVDYSETAIQWRSMAYALEGVDQTTSIRELNTAIALSGSANTEVNVFDATTGDYTIACVHFPNAVTLSYSSWPDQTEEPGSNVSASGVNEFSSSNGDELVTMGCGVSGSGTTEGAHLVVALATAAAASNLTYTNTGGIEYNKVGETIDDVDASAWFTGAVGNVTYVGDTLPDGLSIHNTTGVISGTLSEAEDEAFACEITATDDDDGIPVTGLFTWSITNYELAFTDTQQLLNTSNTAYVPATTVNFSAVKGTIDTTLTTVVEFPVKPLVSGTVTLNSASLTSGTWTVLVQDDTDTTIVGCYEIVAE